jgi:hypothetical protein
MYLMTTNGGMRSRRIERISNGRFDIGYSYYGNKPTLQISAYGQDGVKYTINFTDDDLTKLNLARQSWAEYFER